MTGIELQTSDVWRNGSLPTKPQTHSFVNDIKNHKINEEEA